MAVCRKTLLTYPIFLMVRYVMTLYTAFFVVYIPGHFTRFHYRTISLPIGVTDITVYSVSLVVPTGNPCWFKLRYLEKN